VIICFRTCPKCADRGGTRRGLVGFCNEHRRPTRGTPPDRWTGDCPASDRRYACFRARQRGSLDRAALRARRYRMATFSYYTRSNFFRDGIKGYDWLKQHNRVPKVADLDASHVYLIDVEARTPEHVYFKMQGESWNSSGDTRELIASKGLLHTSMYRWRYRDRPRFSRRLYPGSDGVQVPRARRDNIHLRHRTANRCALGRQERRCRWLRPSSIRRATTWCRCRRGVEPTTTGITNVAQPRQPVQRVRFLVAVDMPVIDPFDASNGVAQRPLGNVGADPCPAHQ
jgi:hypothetical protein